MIGLTLDTVLSDPGVRHAFDVAHQDIVAMGRTDLTHVVRAVLAVLPQEGPTREQVEALDRFTCDLMEDDDLAGTYAYMDEEREGDYVRRADVLALFPKVTGETPEKTL